MAAWERVQDNRGGPGVDGVRIEDFAPDAPTRLRDLARQILGGRYQPTPLRVLRIPKPPAEHEPDHAPTRWRTLAIPCVADRVLQTAVAMILQPRLEREFEDNSFAYRRGRGVQQAVARVTRYRDEGFMWVVDADIEDFFGTIPHDRLIQRLGTLVPNPPLLKLVQDWLRAPLQPDDGPAVVPQEGIPQGSPLSPLLANLYLDTLDEAALSANLRLVRFADDFVVLCRTREKAQEALELTADVLLALELRLNSQKTRIVDFHQGFRFLGVDFVRTLAVPASPRRETLGAPSPIPQPLPPKPNTDTTLAPAVEVPSGESGDEEDALPERRAIDPKILRSVPLMRTLYVLTQGARIDLHGGFLRVHHRDDTLDEVPLARLDLVCLFGDAGMTPAAMHECLQHRVRVALLGRHGRLRGLLAVPGELHGPAERLRLQALVSADVTRCLELAQPMIRAKIGNSRLLLRRLARSRRDDPALCEALHRRQIEMRDLAWQIPGASTPDQLRGLEGAAAKAHFAALRAVIGPQWGFEARQARPAPDPFNAMLSFGYHLLHANVEAFLALHGLATGLGFLHADKPGHATLASDLMEEFRSPCVDACVMDLISRGHITPDDFRLPAGSGDACRMKTGASRRFIHAWETRMRAPFRPYGGATDEWVDLRHMINRQVHHLLRALRNPDEEYEPFVAR
ncbi:MAG: CRISPR-associated endonuclease Cas1 [Pseudomonadota bacterium]|nr:CRISPR-associated endonuclease Cas1 [Pseudomonadota bacterium]